MRRRRARNTTATAATISRKTLIRDTMSGCSWINGSLFESTNIFLMIKELFLISFSNLPTFFYLFICPFSLWKKKILSCVFYCWQEPGARSLLNGWKVATFLLSPAWRVAESSHTFPSIHKFPTFRRADIHRETFKATSKNQPRQ